MNTLARFGTCTAAITLAVAPAATFESPKAAADGGTRVAMDADLRRCDFSRVDNAPLVARALLGTASAVITVAGSTATAEVHLVSGPNPGTHYDVGLIEEPLPSSATCGPGDPGTAFTGLQTDAAGSGTATIRAALRPGTTGVWVIVERASGNTQHPAEYYTSEFLVPV
ncbi:hypothetical protein [Mycobacterium sp.]|uniref:hypothetical protein n=1 Tax=Mycobacterium sp. TaxID=1785 RepID=UPI0025F160BF|nr:hypothetical protein [Mycobacterium sp.]MBW0014392.1 hypothetical protein [Mycobacterium sp.]